MKKKFTMCCVMEQNGSYFSNMHYNGAFLYWYNDCLKIRGIFHTDIFFNQVFWYKLPQKAVLFKKRDIILCYIEKGKTYRYRFRLRAKQRDELVTTLIHYGVRENKDIISEW